MSQLTTQDLQYIDLVLAGDLMNPIWSFEVGVELGFSVNQINGNPWPVILSSDGSDPNRHGHLQLRAAGITQDTIAAVLSVVGTDGNPVPHLGSEYPPVTAAVSMVRVSQDPSSPNYNLFSEKDNRFLVATTLPTADVVLAMNNAGINPASAIILQDPPGDRLQFTLCETCSMNTGLISYDFVTVAPYNEPVDDIRIEMYVEDASGSIFGEIIISEQFRVDNDNFVIKWAGDGTTVKSPEQIFGFRLVNQNPDVELPSAAETKWDIKLLRDSYKAHSSTCAKLTEKNPQESHTFSPFGGFTSAGDTAWFRVEPGKVVPPEYDNKCGSNGNGKKFANEPYQIKINATVGLGYTASLYDLTEILMDVKTVFSQNDVRNIIVQEYWDHFPYRGSNTAWIECKQAGLIASSEKPPRCGDGNFHTMPNPSSFTTAIAITDHYTNQAGCSFEPFDGVWSSDCVQLVSANYHNPSGESYTWNGTPLAQAENTWTQYQTILTTLGDYFPSNYVPLLTSSWRNPERQEAISSVINSDHQFGDAIDLFVAQEVIDLDRRSYDQFAPNVAPQAWCQLAKAAYDAGGTKQTIVENSNTPHGSPYLFEWKSDTVFDADSGTHDPYLFETNSCVDNVREKVETCLYEKYGDKSWGSFDAHPKNFTEEEELRCSPNHVHTAEEQ